MIERFEDIVHLHLSQKMPLKDAIMTAVEKHPASHAEYVFRASNGIEIDNLSQWPKGDYIDFRSAIKSIRELENCSFTEALNKSVSRYPGLYNQYLKEVCEAKS